MVGINGDVMSYSNLVQISLNGSSSVLGHSMGSCISPGSPLVSLSPGNPLYAAHSSSNQSCSRDYSFSDIIEKMGLNYARQAPFPKEKSYRVLSDEMSCLKSISLDNLNWDLLTGINQKTGVDNTYFFYFNHERRPKLSLKLLDNPYAAFFDIGFRKLLKQRTNSARLLGNGSFEFGFLMQKVDEFCSGYRDRDSEKYATFNDLKRSLTQSKQADHFLLCDLSDSEDKENSFQTLIQAPSRSCSDELYGVEIALDALKRGFAPVLAPKELSQKNQQGRLRVVSKFKIPSYVIIWDLDDPRSLPDFEGKNRLLKVIGGISNVMSQAMDICLDRFKEFYDSIPQHALKQEIPWEKIVNSLRFLQESKNQALDLSLQRAKAFEQEQIKEILQLLKKGSKDDIAYLKELAEEGEMTKTVKDFFFHHFELCKSVKAKWDK